MTPRERRDMPFIITIAVVVLLIVVLAVALS